MSNTFFFEKTDTVEQISDKLEVIVADDNRTATGELLDLLESVQDGGIRNSIAIALSDWQEERAVPILLRLLRSNATKNNRGTLIYALQAYDCVPYLPQIAQQICEGNFEVKENAIQIFIDLPEQITEQALDESLQVLDACQSKDDYVDHAIRILKEIAENNRL